MCQILRRCAGIEKNSWWELTLILRPSLVTLPGYSCLPFSRGFRCSGMWCSVAVLGSWHFERLMPSHSRVKESSLGLLDQCTWRQNVGTSNPMTQCHILAHQNPMKHHCKNLKSCTIFQFWGAVYLNIIIFCLAVLPTHTKMFCMFLSW